MPRWIRSLGGPLILVPHDAVHAWTGAYGPDGDDEVDEEDTEYWRVSARVEDYAESVDVRGVQALVLANGGCPTTFANASGVFVQELSAGSRVDAMASARRALARVEWSHHTTWNCAGRCLLFDAARFGPSVQEPDALLVDLAPGQYTVSSAYWVPHASEESAVAITRVHRRE